MQRTLAPPSGVTIILQTECHALETADKKINVTTASWWRRDRGERDGKKRGDRRTKEEKQEGGGASTAPAKTSPRDAASPVAPLISPTVAIAGSCSPPPASHLFPFQNRLFQREGRGEFRPWLQTCGPHNANLISSPSSEDERRRERRRKRGVKK